MSRLFIHSADVLVTMDGGRREIADGAVVIEGNDILAVGTTGELRARYGRDADRIIDARGTVVLPGLVNCHHHLYQTLTRALCTGRGLELFDWLKFLYGVWAGLDSEAIHVSAKAALCELVLSGATTVADHLYLFPNGARLDDELRGAAEVGVRFHAVRGSMSLGESDGGLPPDALCEAEEDVLRDCRRLIEEFHDPRPRSMVRIDLGPCSPFSVTPDLMRESAALARSFENVNLHTHLAETLDEERFCLERFGLRPMDYAESVEWLGPDVWFAHGVHLTERETERMAETRSGVCHCPSSNMILSSGVAPIRRMLDAGVRLGLGVDGSASNDGNQLLGEARQAMLLQRVSGAALTAREALELATLGGSRLLNRPEIGSLCPGRAADLVAFRVDDLAHAGAGSDPVAGLLTCAPARAWLSVIDGRIVVEDGELLTVDLPRLVENHNRLSRRLVERSGAV